jgi:hypothetical protein
MTKKEFQVKYTSRGFAQDAEQAMRGDVIRGLIELITNCDDAYGEKSGEIRVVVNRTANSDGSVEVAVTDKAKGLSPDEMEKAFTHLGSETSGFADGASVRGLFGRGSKDTAWFGRTVFESIKAGVFSEIILNRDGKGSLDFRDATTDDYGRLGLKEFENGLTARMQIQPLRAKAPELSKLAERLSSHVQLRQLNVKNNVMISEFKKGKQTKQASIVWELPAHEEIFDEEIEIKEYGTKARLVIRKLAQRINENISDYSFHGIEIRGKRASYMNTGFGLVGPGIGFISGVVECPKIDELIRQYDADEITGSPSPANPIRMITRDRNGLAGEHPFVRALTVAVLEKLKPIVDSLEPKQSDTGGSELKKSLDRLARMLGELMKQDLDEDEDSDNISGNLPSHERPIVVIPPISRGAIGSKRSLTVLIHKDFAVGGISVKLNNENCSVLLAPTQPTAHSIFENVMVAHSRLSLNTLGSTRATFYANSDEEISGAADILVHNDPTPEEDPPAVLMWKNSVMSVTVGKERPITLLAPIDVAPDGVLTAEVSIEGDGVSLLENKVSLNLVSKGWLVGKLRVKGVKIGGPFKITATAGTQVSKGTIKTSLPSAIAGLNFEVKLEPLDEGPNRGRVVEVENGRQMLIWTKNPAVAAYLGKLNDDGSYSNEHAPDTKAALAETIASIAADYVLRREVLSDPSMYRDVDMVIQKRTTLTHRYLKMLIEGLRGSQ